MVNPADYEEQLSEAERLLDLFRETGELDCIETAYDLLNVILCEETVPALFDEMLEEL